jgi:hypothetical protein
MIPQSKAASNKNQMWSRLLNEKDVSFLFGPALGGFRLRLLVGLRSGRSVDTIWRGAALEFRAR